MAIDEFSRSLPMLLYRVLDAVMPRFRRIFNEYGLTEQQWRVLRVLHDREPINLRELAALTVIPGPSLVGIVDRLEASGTVLRKRSENDRRVVHVVTTDRGRELIRTIMPRVGEAYSALMQTIEPRDWIRLIDGLEKVAELEQTNV